MSVQEEDGIFQLMQDSESVEAFLLELDTSQRKYELVTALEAEGRLYELENNLEFSKLDTLTVGIARKLYEYHHRNPSRRDF